LQQATALLREAQPLRPLFERGPFDEKSLFAKTLAKVAEPGQIAPRVVPVQALAPRLEWILTDWELAAARIDRLDCQLTQFTYDPALEVESRGTGTLTLDRTGRAAFELNSATIQPGDVSRKIGKDGRPFRLKADQPARWHWTDSQVVRIDPAARTFEEWSNQTSLTTRSINGEFHPEPPPLPSESAAADNEPPADSLQNLASLFPFVLGMSVDDLVRQFEVELLRDASPDAWLKLKPRSSDAVGPFREVTLILGSAPNYRPSAVKVVSNSGLERVLVFRNLDVNRAPLADAARLERPNLRGYRRISRPDLPPP
jgi:hypothetical protein